jgi:hypothetical protein
MLGVIGALREWRCYLEGRRFTIITDYKPKTELDTASNIHTLKRRAHWLEESSGCEYVCRFRKGRINIVDPISRAPQHFTFLCGVVPVQWPPIGEHGECAHHGLEAVHDLGIGRLAGARPSSVPGGRVGAACARARARGAPGHRVRARGNVSHGRRWGEESEKANYGLRENGAWASRRSGRARLWKKEKTVSIFYSAESAAEITRGPHREVSRAGKHPTRDPGCAPSSRDAAPPWPRARAFPCSFTTPSFPRATRTAWPASRCRTRTVS